MTYLFDSSASLAGVFGEPGVERVRELLQNAEVVVGVSTLTIYETYTTVRSRTGSEENARKAVEDLRAVVAEVVPVSEKIVELAMELRSLATARIATVDCLIAATALQRGAILVHRDPHFDALPAERLAQEKLPDKK